MALFSRSTKKTAAKKVPAKKAAVVSKKAVSAVDFSWVLLSPRITEKATDVAEKNVYVFDVAVAANKPQIASAIQQLYKVHPRKVNVVNIRGKSVRNPRTGITGKKASGRKAYVYLKEGETISLM